MKIDLPKMGEPLESMVDGTLFKARYDGEAAVYRVESHTPVDGRGPLKLGTLITREEATQYRESNWMLGYSIDTAALKIGAEKLAEEIPGALRKLRQGEVVKQELEALEGFGSF